MDNSDFYFLGICVGILAISLMTLKYVFLSCLCVVIGTILGCYLDCKQIKKDVNCTTNETKEVKDEIIN